VLGADDPAQVIEGLLVDGAASATGERKAGGVRDDHDDPPLFVVCGQTTSLSDNIGIASGVDKT
jgi:hypothetical protein